MIPFSYQGGLIRPSISLSSSTRRPPLWRTGFVYIAKGRDFGLCGADCGSGKVLF